MVFKLAKLTKAEQNQNRYFPRHVFDAIFLFTRHSSVFQTIPWNWEHLTNLKVQGKKVFRHLILHSYLCKALCKFFIKSESIVVFLKHILKLKVRDQSVQARKKLCDSKELFVQRFVKVSDQNWKHVEARNQITGTPGYSTLPWQECQKQAPEVLYKKDILKNFAISTGNTCVRVYFQKSCRPLKLQLY